MTLDAERPLAFRTAEVASPCFAAIELTVSPARTVWCEEAVRCDELADFADVESEVSRRCCPGKIMVFQPRPLSARTDAVDSPNLPAISLTVSPSVTRYVCGVDIVECVPAVDAVAAALALEMDTLE